MLLLSSNFRLILLSLSLGSVRISSLRRASSHSSPIQKPLPSSPEKCMYYYVLLVDTAIRFLFAFLQSHYCLWRQCKLDIAVHCVASSLS